MLLIKGKTVKEEKFIAYGRRTCIEWERGIERSMKISVIIPIYNGERYLEEAVRSVLYQPYKDIEVICVNDGSKDDSGRILANLQREDNRIRVISKENQGVAAARNDGLCHASGDYVAFLDQDDRYVKNAVTMEIMEKIVKYECDIISFAHYVSNESMSQVKLFDRKEALIESPITVIGENYRHHSSYFYKRTFVLEKGVITTEYRHEDERFRTQCILLARNMLYISQPLFIYRNNGNSVTHAANSGERVLLSVLDGWFDLMKTTPYTEVKEFALNTVPRLFVELCHYTSVEKNAVEKIHQYMNRYKMSDIISGGGYINSNNQKEWDLMNCNIQKYVRKHKYSVLKMRIAYQILHSNRMFVNIYHKRKYPMPYDSSIL